jgi:N-methylhydantoinase B/oxoprolinase/acetone carboxylase alpha subunit
MTVTQKPEQDDLFSDNERLSLVEKLQKKRELTNPDAYYGIEELQLREENPPKFERFYSRLLNAAQSARQTAKNVAASPGTREMGELLFEVATPEGDAIAISMGLQGHLDIIPIGIEHMIENEFETNPGIEKGDIFGAADPLTCGAPHPGDVFSYMPIMKNGECIAWAAGMNHIMDVGAVQPGSWPPYSPTTYSDGFIYPPMQIGDDFQHHSWWYDLWRRRTRAPDYNILDEKMRLSGLKLIHDRVLNVIQEFGVEYFRRGIREIIAETAHITTRSIRAESIPGQYEHVSYRGVLYEGVVDEMVPHASENHLLHTPSEVTVTSDGRIETDLEGISPAGYHTYGGTDGVLRGAHILNFCDAYAYHAKVNSGIALRSEINNPEGSLFNPGGVNAPPGTPSAAEAPASNPWGVVYGATTGVSLSSARANLARGFLEEAWMGDQAWNGTQGEVKMPNGDSFGTTNFEQTGAMGSPAQPFRDGELVNWAIHNPQTDWGNAEEFEFAMPGIHYLNRGKLTDYTGHGRHRGGIGTEVTFYLEDDVEGANMNRGGCPPSMTASYGTCASGGYPSPGCFTATAEDTNLLAINEDGTPYPRGLRELKEFKNDGDHPLEVDEYNLYDYDTPPLQVEAGDIFVSAAGSSSGWGDPIERKPELIEEDLNENNISPSVAKRIYGAVVGEDEDGEWSVDEEATAEHRDEIRGERKDEAQPVEEWWSEERERFTEGDFKADITEKMYKECSYWEKFEDRLTTFWQTEPEWLDEEVK